MSKGNSAEEKYQTAIDNQYAYDQEMWSFNWANAQDSYAFQQEAVAIQQINDNAIRNYQDQTNFNGWLNRENMRMYEYGKQIQAYNSSVDTYERQLDYNDIAADIAINDANRVYQDQLIAFGFQNQDLLMKYHEGGDQAALDTEGLTIKLAQAQELAGLQIKDITASKEWQEAQSAIESQGLRDGLAAVKADAAFKRQAGRIDTLGKEGKQRNLGQAGRSAAKAIQGLLSTHGVTQAALADTITKADSKYMLDQRKVSESLVNNARMAELKYSDVSRTLLNTRTDAQHQQDQIGLKFSQLKDRTDFGRLQLQQSMISAGEQHHANLTKIDMDKYQQDINASANLMPEPTLPPQEIAPIGIPETTYQNPIGPTMPPAPLEGTNTYQGPSTFDRISQGIGIATGLFQLAGFLSDLELKDNIVRKGRSKRGFPIYEFNYKWDNPDQRYQGVMGQDLLKLYPEAVREGDNGYLEVIYDLLDVEFKKV